MQLASAQRSKKTCTANSFPLALQLRLPCACVSFRSDAMWHQTFIALFSSPFIRVTECREQGTPQGQRWPIPAKSGPLHGDQASLISSRSSGLGTSSFQTCGLQTAEILIRKQASCELYESVSLYELVGAPHRSRFGFQARHQYVSERPAEGSNHSIGSLNSQSSTCSHQILFRIT